MGEDSPPPPSPPRSFPGGVSLTAAPRPRGVARSAGGVRTAVQRAGRTWEAAAAGAARGSHSLAGLVGTRPPRPRPRGPDLGGGLAGNVAFLGRPGPLRLVCGPGREDGPRADTMETDGRLEKTETKRRKGVEQKPALLTQKRE